MSEAKPGDFEGLLKSLGEVVEQTDVLAKAAAAPKDDETVAAAAADSGIEPGDDDDEPGDDDEPMAKSDAGDFVDATDMLKSIVARQDGVDTVLAKAIGSLTGALTKQNDLIKSLQTEVQSLRGQGRGRKAVLSVSEKPGLGDLAKSQAAADDGKITPGELLAKSELAFKAGKISGVEHNTVDVCLRSGWGIDPGLLTKIAQA